MVFQNDDRIRFLYELGECLAIAFGIDTTDTGTVPSYIFFLLVHFCPYLGIIFVPHHSISSIWQVLPILLVGFDHMVVCNVFGR